jgi:hypothetical protein
MVSSFEGDCPIFDFIRFAEMRLTISNLSRFSDVGRGCIFAAIPPVLGILQTVLTHVSYAMIVGGLPFSQACNGLLRFWISREEGPRMFFWHAILPYLALATAMFVVLASRSFSRHRIWCVLAGGLIGILLVVFPFDHKVWMDYFGGRYHSTISAMIWIPMPLIAWGTSIVGVGFGWLVSYTLRR